MTEQMPVVTEERRLALIKWLEKEAKMIQEMRDEIPFGLDEDGENALLGVTIALESLQSKPEYYYRTRSDGGRDGPLHESKIEDVRKKSWIPLYTATPVPVLKPVVLPRDAVLTTWYQGCGYESEHAEGVRIGWNLRGDADKEAIRAAGYEVKHDK